MELFVKLLHLCVRFLVPSSLVCELDLVVAAQDGGNLLFVEGLFNDRVLVEVAGIILHVQFVASSSKELGLGSYRLNMAAMNTRQYGYSDSFPVDKAAMSIYRYQDPDSFL